MVFSPKQVEFFARAIVNRLEDRGLVEFHDAEAGIELVSKILTENFGRVEDILAEARDRLLERKGNHPTWEEVSAEAEQVAAERGFVL